MKGVNLHVGERVSSRVILEPLLDIYVPTNSRQRSLGRERKRERYRLCVCVCVRERERESERERE